MQILSKENGFTLLEAVLVILIIGVLAVLIGAPLIQGSLAWQAVSTRKEATQQVRMGLDRMARELRNIQRTPADLPNVIDISATCVNFVDVNNQQIVFRFNGGALERGTGGTCAAPTGVNLLASNVSAFTVTCYNNQNAVLACNLVNAPNVRRLKLDLTTLVGSETVELTSQILFRSLLFL